MDYFGIEAIVGDILTPESQTAGISGFISVWWLREIQRQYGYDEVPVSAAPEFGARSSGPGALTERQLSDYYVRDALHCHAYGFPLMNTVFWQTRRKAIMLQSGDLPGFYIARLF